MIQVGSLFTQVLSLVDRHDFSRAVRQWDAEHGAKGFRCGDQFVAMMFCQLGGADSLREICSGLSTAVAKTLDFEPGTIVVIDRGYVDYDLFDYWTGEGVWFVTRAKDNMAYRVVKSRKVPHRGNVLRDEEIEFTGYEARRIYPNRLRRIVVRDEENDRDIVLLTNHMDFAAGTIARIYKDRWQIELFFKAIKQNLKIKTFVGTSENAVKTQIWTALLCMLILKILQMRSTFGWSLSNLAAMLRFNLLTYRDLWVWLDRPYQTPALGPPDGQLLLFG
jgi:IS4 transposase